MFNEPQKFVIHYHHNSFYKIVNNVFKLIYLCNILFTKALLNSPVIKINLLVLFFVFKIY